MTDKTITVPQVGQPKGSGSLEFDGLLAAFHAIVWATAEDDDPELAYDEAGNVEAKKLQAMYRSLQLELTKARKLLVEGEYYGPARWQQKVAIFLQSNQSAPADKGQGEPDAIVTIGLGGTPMQWFSRKKFQPGEHKLYLHPSEQPAPVAVSLPERKTVKAGLLSESNTHNQGWNACLDELARLNSEPKP